MMNDVATYLENMILEIKEEILEKEQLLYEDNER